jgi:hypothetical protein
MKINNGNIPVLFDALSRELERRKPFMSLRVLSEVARQRQGLGFTNAQYFISVLENHLWRRTASAVFTIELLDEICVLRFCVPLRPKEYARLESSGYAPVLRSKVHLSVGLDVSGGVPYAYSCAKISRNGNVVDLFDTLFTLGKELEKYLHQ